MKVQRGVMASIGVAVLIAAAPDGARAAEAATCGETYYLCINDASQTDGFLARTWAEQKCNAGWYSCVKNQAFGA